MTIQLNSCELEGKKFEPKLHCLETNNGDYSIIWIDFHVGDNRVEFFLLEKELSHVLNEMTLLTAQLEELLEKRETAKEVEKWSDIVPASPPGDDDEIPF